jgi:hypothetical protein
MHPDKAHRKKLEKCRESFRILVADGQYPPDRQQRLFQACQSAGIDWNEARQFIQPEAEAFYERVVARFSPAEMLVPATIEELQRLRRRLGLSQPMAMVQQQPSLPAGQIQVNIAPRPVTWRQRMIETLVLFKLSVASCMMLIVGAIVLIMLFFLCMGIYYMGMAGSTMPRP